MSAYIHAALRAAIRRSTAARNRFKRLSGFPKGRPGYVIDHMVPLRCGGGDVPSNMQWSTLDEAKAKDRWERHCDRWIPQAGARVAGAEHRALAARHASALDEEGDAP